MRAPRLRPALALAAASTLLAGACSEGGEAALSAKAREGRSVYRANCTACHNVDPTRPGGVGPAIAGSPLELLRAKVLRGEYPPGYTPKRESSAMPRLPHLEESLPALAAYLRAAAGTTTAAPSEESAAAAGS